MTRRISTFTRYNLVIAVAALAAAAAWYALVMLTLGVPTASSAHSAALIERKSAIAAGIRDPKIITVSGSNGQFGIRTALMSERLGVPAINMGIAAGIGLDHILTVGRNVARPGDVMILALEYALLTDDSKPDETKVDFVFAHDPDYLRGLDVIERARLVFAMPPARLVSGLENRLRPTKFSYTGPYSITSINANGDETRNILANQGPRAKARVLGAGPDLRLLTRADPLNPRVRSKLEALRDWCREHGVTLAATFPATMYFPEYESLEARNAFTRVRAGYEALGIPVLGTPRDFMFERNRFYDTAEHLLSDAMIERTEKLLAALAVHPALVPRNSQSAGVAASAVPVGTTTRRSGAPGAESQ